MFPAYRYTVSCSSFRPDVGDVMFTNFGSLHNLGENFISWFSRNAVLTLSVLLPVGNKCKSDADLLFPSAILPLQYLSNQQLCIALF